jgi:hypothetical protein
VLTVCRTGIVVRQAAERRSYFPLASQLFWIPSSLDFSVSLNSFDLSASASLGRSSTSCAEGMIAVVVVQGRCVLVLSDDGSIRSAC